ncbi:hypothetical protein ABBQ38_000612 [Trebouxia sp. C0009 RCD-2024]
MTTPSELETVRKEIHDLKAEILNTKEALAGAHVAADVDFLCKQLERLHTEKIVLQEKENILLQGHASV